MITTTSEAPFQGASPTLPPPPARQLRRMGTIVAAFAVLATLAAGLVQPAPAGAIPPDGRDITCIAQTKLVKFTAKGGPFMGGTRLDWEVTSPCPEVKVTLNGIAASRIGTVVYDPAVTTVYELFVSMGSRSKFLDYQVALAGDIADYTVVKKSIAVGPTLGSGTTAGGVKARRVANGVVNTLPREAKLKLVGKSLEIHVIPAKLPLTWLPLWKHLRDTMTCDAKKPGCDFPRPWNDIRGTGGVEWQPGRIALAVGEENLVLVDGMKTSWSQGHVLVHELGHTILTHATTEYANVDKVLKGNPSNHDYLGLDAYTKSDAGEYFAEGTAAMFGFEGRDKYSGEYTQAWLEKNEPKLFAILKRVYPGA